MPKISEDQRQERRDQILAATWQCFYRSGIHSTSMEEIIREAGLSAGAVYLYYKGKDELIVAAITTYMAALRDLLVPILSKPQPLPPLEFIRAITSAMSRFTKRSGFNLNTIILMCWSEAQTNPQVKSLIATFQTNYRAALTQVVARWQKSGELASTGNPKDVAKVLLSFFQGFIAQSALLGELDAGTITRGMAGLIGTRTKPQRART